MYVLGTVSRNFMNNNNARNIKPEITLFRVLPTALGGVVLFDVYIVCELRQHVYDELR